jgi:predicted Zn-dependent protease
LVHRLRRAWPVTMAAVLLWLHAFAWTTPAHAQGISFLRDAETERFLYDAVRPIVVAAGLEPASVHMYLVGDNSINAFVAGGQNIFMHSGLLLEATDVNEVIGVMAHEAGHITGGHLARMGEGYQDAMAISLLSMLLGAAAIAAGAGDAGSAIMMGGQTAATGRFFAFTRVQESAADQAGATFLEKAGISGRGLISFFEKLEQYLFKRGIVQDAYWNTHPLTRDRIERLQERVSQSPYYDKPADPDLQYRFMRVRAKLAGYVWEPQTTFSVYPESDTSEFARYARAYAWHKTAQMEQARAELDALLKIRPDDPFYLELLGQVLLESGQVQEAIPYLRRAVAKAPQEPLIRAMLGHALLATEDAALGKEAVAMLEESVRQDKQNPFAWYQLGMAYGKRGDESRAALASAERFSLVGAPREAFGNARRAMQGLPKGSPEWLRAQDILIVSEEALKDKRRRRS